MKKLFLLRYETDVRLNKFSGVFSENGQGIVMTKQEYLVFPNNILIDNIGDIVYTNCYKVLQHPIFFMEFSGIFCNNQIFHCLVEVTNLTVCQHKNVIVKDITFQKSIHQDYHFLYPKRKIDIPFITLPPTEKHHESIAHLWEKKEYLFNENNVPEFDIFMTTENHWIISEKVLEILIPFCPYAVFKAEQIWSQY